MDKKAVRKNIREKIAQMTEAQQVSQSLCVCQTITETSEWKNAKEVLLYAAMADELSLQALFQNAFDTNKRIWLPVVDGDVLIIREYLEGKTSVSEGFHIEEPTDEAPLLMPEEYNRLDLAIIPGRAFTISGDRLGRGKGYYDRFLTQYQGTTIGVCFKCQILDSIPVDPWDKKLDLVFVES